MEYLLMALLAGLALGLDQLTKLLTVTHIAPHAQIPVIPGIVHLTYAQNTGAAFSMLRGQQWLFALIFGVFTIFLLIELWKKPLKLPKFERFCAVAIWAGGLGNMIDRLRLGYVIDMIETEFITFPVFNVADCFITCGAILLIAHMLLTGELLKK